MVRALCQLTQNPQEMATILNSLLIEDSMKQHFSFSYLVLLPKENLFRFISCRCGHLWIRTAESKALEAIGSDNPSLGADPNAQFIAVEHPWNPMDSLIFHASLGSRLPGKEDLFTGTQLQSAFDESTYAAAQKRVDSYMRKAKVTLNRATDERSVIFLNIVRGE